MSLVFNHGSLITVNGDATININTAVGLPQGHCDLSVIGIGNFASGNYVQKSSDVTDIESNFTLSTTAIRGAGFYLATPPAGTGVTLTAFGNAVHNSGENLEITGRKKVGNHDTGVSQKWFANLVVMNGVRGNVSDADSLLKGKGGAGAVLVQAAASALFKQLGKHAALNNDTTISARQTKMSNDMAEAFDEASFNYQKSVIFQRYLASGRYADDNADVNTSVDYNLDGTAYDFIVQLSGNVTDSDSPTPDTLNISVILGDKAAGETKVAADGSYKFNVFMRLQHETDV